MLKIHNLLLKIYYNSFFLLILALVMSKKLTREISGLLVDDEVNEINFKDLILTETIGKGSFGRVWTGKYPQLFIRYDYMGGCACIFWLMVMEIFGH